MRKFTVLLALLALPVLAQDIGGFFGPARTVRFFSASPATCAPTGPNIGLNTTTGLLGWCSATNTWTYPVSSSGGTFTGQLNLANGTATEPSWGWTSDDDTTGTGMFRGCANCLSFTTNGIERWLINASGSLNPLTANTYDIGGTTTIRDIGIGRNAILSGSTSGTATLHAAAISGTSDITLPTGTVTLATLTGSETLTNKTLTAPVLTAPTTDTIQTSGNVGVGTAPSGTVGELLSLVSSGDQTTRLDVLNSDAAGTTTTTTVRIRSSTATLGLFARGPGNTTSRWGGAVGGWNEVLGNAGSGIVVGTTNSSPVLLGVASQTRLLVSGAAKALTESSATAVANVSLASNTVCAGTFRYTVQANDASDYQARRGEVQFVAVNKAGTITTTAGTPTENVAVSAGTLTAAFTVTTGASTFALNLNAVSSLTQTTLTAAYSVQIDGGTCNATAAP